MSSSLLQHKDEKIFFCVLVSGSLGSVAWTRKNFVLLPLMGVHVKQVKFRDNIRTYPMVCMGVCGPTIPLRGVSKIFWPPPLDFPFSPWDWQSAGSTYIPPTYMATVFYSSHKFHWNLSFFQMSCQDRWSYTLWKRKLCSRREHLLSWLSNWIPMSLCETCVPPTLCKWFIFASCECHKLCRVSSWFQVS